MAVRIPQIDPALLARWAEAKGMATAAPFQAAGNVMGKVQERIQKRKLQTQIDQIKNEEKQRKDAEFVVKMLKDSGMLEPIARNMLGQGQMPTSPQGMMQTLQGMQFQPTQLQQIPKVKSDEVLLTPERIKMLEDKGLIEKGSYAPNKTMKISEYRKLWRGLAKPEEKAVKKAKVPELSYVQKENIKTAKDLRKNIIKKLEKDTPVTREEIVKVNNFITKINNETGTKIPLFALKEPKTKAERKSWLNKIKSVFSSITSAKEEKKQTAKKSNTISNKYGF